MEDSWSSNENSESGEKSQVNAKENNENNLKNISPYMSKDMIAAAGFNVETPIVNAIIGNLTGSLPTKKNETEFIKCEVCDCELSSSIVFRFHVNGSKHKKRLRALEIIAQLKDAKDKTVQLGNNDNPKAFRCEICAMTVNSPQQLEIHLSGSKHKKKAAKEGVTEPETPDQTKPLEVNENTVDNNSITQPAAKKKKKEDPIMIPCKICNIHVNSQTQYKQHLLSKKHINNVAWKQPQRKMMQRKYVRFQTFTPGARPQFQMNNPNQVFNNQSQQFNPQMYNRLFPYSNFLTNNHFFNNSGNRGEPRPKLHKNFQKRF